jgi:hypothetical protein
MCDKERQTDRQRERGRKRLKTGDKASQPYVTVTFYHCVNKC